MGSSIFSVGASTVVPFDSGRLTALWTKLLTCRVRLRSSSLGLGLDDELILGSIGSSTSCRDLQSRPSRVIERVEVADICRSMAALDCGRFKPTGSNVVRWSELHYSIIMTIFITNGAHSSYHGCRGMAQANSSNNLTPDGTLSVSLTGDMFLMPKRLKTLNAFM